MKIRTQITLPIVLLVSFALILMFSFLTFVMEKHFEAQYFEHLKTTANLKAKSLESLLNNIEAEAQSWNYGLRKDLLIDTVENHLSVNPERDVDTQNNLTKNNWFTHLDILDFEAGQLLPTERSKNESNLSHFLDNQLIDPTQSGFSDILMLGLERDSENKDIVYRVDKFDMFSEQRGLSYSSAQLRSFNPEHYFFYVLPIVKNYELIGAALFQINLRIIDDILEDRVGLGKSGETYLVGRDRLMRSNSRFTSESTRLVQRVETSNVEHCFAHREMNADNWVFDDYRPVKVLGNHSYIEKLDWCLMSEIDFDEAQQVPRFIFLVIMVTLLLLLVFLWFGIHLISSQITGPIVNLEKAVQSIDGNNWDLKLPKGQSSQEIENLKQAFQNMVGVISEGSRKLSEQQQKLALVVENIGEGILVINQKQEAILFNKAATNISGFSAEKLFCNDYKDCLEFYDKDKKQIKGTNKILKKMKAQQSLEDFIFLKSKRGQYIPIACVVSAFKNEKKRIAGHIIIFRDISKEVEVDRMKTEFVSIASHQLRTPLTAVKWIIELFKEDTADILSKAQSDQLAQVELSCERMMILVNDLLDVSRIETGRNFALDKKPCNIHDCLFATVADLKPLAAKEKILLDIHENFSKSLMLTVDVKKIEQVFHNFISNAIKYSAASSTIKIALNDQAKQIVFSVSDNGIGIPESEHDSIFQKFYRASNSQKTKAQGTGLGLYIARRIVEAHGGKVWFESQKNKGATFYFSLPKS